jgi:hypothetical protein
MRLRVLAASPLITFLNALAATILTPIHAGGLSLALRGTSYDGQGRRKSKSQQRNMLRRDIIRNFVILHAAYAVLCQFRL